MKGFALVEILIGIALAGIALAVIPGLLNSNSNIGVLIGVGIVVSGIYGVANYRIVLDFIFNIYDDIKCRIKKR